MVAIPENNNLVKNYSELSPMPISTTLSLQG